MSESFLIALREGLEAALVVSIVLSFARRRGDARAVRAIWTGTGAALLVSAVTGVVLHVLIDGLEGVARLRTFAAISIAAAGLLTWMIFWMRRHGRVLKQHLEEQTAGALAGGSATALALVAFVAVIREGLETALFLLSATSTSDSGEIAAGTVLGLAVASGLGVLLYKGSERFNLRQFFDVTGVLIILFAAGLVAKAILFLQGAGDVGTFDNAVYDLTSVELLTVETQTGRFLGGIFGWDPRPSIEQVVGYLAYLAPIMWLYFRPTKPVSAPQVSHVRSGAAYAHQE